MEYIYLDKSSKTKSIVNIDGTNVEFWYQMFLEFGEETTERYLQAEAHLKEGKIQEAFDLIEADCSGENTIQVTTVYEDGQPTTTVTGQDTRSFFQKWKDRNAYLLT